MTKAAVPRASGQHPSLSWQWEAWTLRYVFSPGCHCNLSPTHISLSPLSADVLSPPILHAAELIACLIAKSNCCDIHCSSALFSSKLGQVAPMKARMDNSCLGDRMLQSNGPATVFLMEVTQRGQSCSAGTHLLLGRHGLI